MAIWGAYRRLIVSSLIGTSGGDKLHNVNVCFENILLLHPPYIYIPTTTKREEGSALECFHSFSYPSINGPDLVSQMT